MQWHICMFIYYWLCFKELISIIMMLCCNSLNDHFFIFQIFSGGMSTHVQTFLPQCLTLRVNKWIGKKWMCSLRVKVWVYWCLFGTLHAFSMQAWMHTASRAGALRPPKSQFCNQIKSNQALQQLLSAPLCRKSQIKRSPFHPAMYYKYLQEIITSLSHSLG